MERDIGPTRARLGVGASLFLLGISKKLLIADRMASIVDPVFANPREYSAPSIACAVIAYTIQIYADFSGYSDMAIGTAKAIGYDLPENFNMPYLASSLTEFWRRWHMTLSNWLRDYLYIPLGGNRHGALRTYVNLALTMLLGGLWHGASWNFVLWGALHGGGLAVHRMVSRRRGARPWPWLLAQPITLFFVMLCWIPFRAPTLDVTRVMLVRLFTWDTSGARFVPEALAWCLGLMVVGHAVGASLEKEASRTLASRLLRIFDIDAKHDPMSGRYLQLHVGSIAGAFLVTVWFFAVFFFGAVQVSPFIYFQF
jgi:alginate O-acetyltransferase complex protein AlgI